MIDVIVSDLCPHCQIQLGIMEKSFFPDEFKVIHSGSKEFEAYDLKDKVDATPFIIVRGENGEIKYADKGTVDGTALRQIERIGKVAKEKTFNLYEARMAGSFLAMAADGSF